jgi:chemotaxis protein MotB
MRIRSIFEASGVLLGAFLAIACGVAPTEHQAVLAELEACRSERETLTGKLDTLSQERETLVKNLEALDMEFQNKLSASKEELEELRQQRAEAERHLQEFQSLTEKFKEMVAAEGITVYRRRGRLIVALPSSVLFPSGKDDLSELGTETLAKVAAKLKDFEGRRLLVAGHTDNVPVGKDLPFQDNWELSTARALRVLRFLVEQGLDARNLAAAGYGQFDPVRSNNTKQGRRLNRRIELILEPRIPDIDLPRLEQLSDGDDAQEATGDSDE